MSIGRRSEYAEKGKDALEFSASITALSLAAPFYPFLSLYLSC
jgi:hypothetical protein